MKKLGFILLFICPLFSLSQKVFEGKITYAYRWDKYDSILKGDSILMITYFSPGKIRTDMFVSNNDISKDDTYVVGFLDSNVYYVLHPIAKKADRILIDTSGLIDFKIMSSVALNDEIEVLGRKCYGVKEIMKYNLPSHDSDTSFTMQVISHYAKGLYYPYKITPYFSQSSTTYNNNICLSTKTSFNNGVFGTLSGSEILLAAIKIEQFKNPDSLFQIPSSFAIETIKMSQLLKDSVETKVTVKEIKLEELKQEEDKPEPPPPPPPKKTSKSPAKKPIKQKSGNN